MPVQRLPRQPAPHTAIWYWGGDFQFHQHSFTKGSGTASFVFNEGSQPYGLESRKNQLKLRRMRGNISHSPLRIRLTRTQAAISL